MFKGSKTRLKRNWPRPGEWGSPGIDFGGKVRVVKVHYHDSKPGVIPWWNAGTFEAPLVVIQTGGSSCWSGIGMPRSNHRAHWSVCRLHKGTPDDAEMVVETIAEFPVRPVFQAWCVTCGGSGHYRYLGGHNEEVIEDCPDCKPPRS